MTEAEKNTAVYIYIDYDLVAGGSQKQEVSKVNHVYKFKMNELNVCEFNCWKQCVSGN